MVPGIDQASLRIHEGLFSFHTIKLMAHFNHENPDYRRFDPKTWPIITSQHVEDYVERTGQNYGKLPSYVAYEPELVWLVKSPDAELETANMFGIKGRCAPMFYEYPYFFKQSGRQKKVPHITEDEYVA